MNHRLLPALLAGALTTAVSFSEPIEINQPMAFTAGIRGAIELTFPSSQGVYYQVEFSEDLSSWNPEGHAIKGTGGEMSVLASTRNKATGYYRVRDDGDSGNLAPSVPPTSQQIIDALGYTPANLTSENITGTLGYTPAESGVGFMERFFTYANGSTVIGGTTQPQTGPVWQVAVSGNGEPPFVTGGALRAADGALIYIGAGIPTINRKFSLTFVWELRASIYPDGMWDGGPTIAINDTPVVNESGAAGINPIGAIHLSFSRSGITSNDIYGVKKLLPLNDPDNGLWHAACKGIAYGTKILTNVTVEGSEMRVSAFGKTFIYQDPLIADCVGPTTYFYYESAGDSLLPGYGTIRSVAYLHNIWANAPELDRLVGIGAGGGLASQLETGIEFVYPGRMRFLNGTNFARVLPGPGDALAITGDLVSEGLLYSRPAGAPSQQPASVSSSTLAIASVSPAGAAGFQAMAVPCLAQTKAGTVETTTVWGHFGANSNNKRIRLQWLGGTKLDTGNLDENGKAWKLTILRNREATVSHRNFYEFSSESLTKRGFDTYNHGNSYSTFNILVDGVAAGDIVIDGSKTEVSHPPR